MITKSVRDHLADSGCRWRVLQHPLAVDGAHLAEALGVSGHRVAKALLIEAGGGRLLAAIPASSQLDLQALSRLLGVAAQLAPESLLAEQFPRCELGAAPPLGRLWGLPLVLDAALVQPGPIYFRGGSHDEAIELDGAAFIDLEQPVVAAISFESEALVGGSAPG